MAPRLTPVQLAAFSMPMLLFQAIELAWRTYLPAFLAQTVGLPIATIGSLLLFARLFDAAAAPTIGWASDRLTGALGARRTWMLIGAPLVSVGAVGLFTLPAGATFATVFAWAVTLHLGYALIVTPHGGWGLEIGTDSRERTRIQGMKVWLAAGGGVLIVAALSVAERGYAATRGEQMLVLAGIIAVLAPLTTILLTAFVRQPATSIRLASVAPVAQLRAILSDSQLATTLWLYLLTGFAEGASGAVLIFFIEDGLVLPGWASSLVLVQSVMMLLALPFWVRWSQQGDRWQVLLAIYTWQSITAVLGFFVPAGQATVAIAFLALRYATGAGEFVLLRAITAEGVARDAGVGRRTGASSYALFNVMLAGAMGVGGATVMSLLAASGYGQDVSATSGQQTIIRAAFLLPTILAGSIGCVLLLAFRRAQRSGARTAAC
jgi:glycoside/pentoside/hexuronide:cation symporter, GPH family